MGFTALLRWQNAPTTALETVHKHITETHQGVPTGLWRTQIRAYRSMFMATDIKYPERSMTTLTMGDNTFVLIEDRGNPTWAEMNEAQAAMQASQSQVPSNNASIPGTQTQDTFSDTTERISPSQTQSNPPLPPFRLPPHYSMNMFTVRSPGALEHLIGQLRARWVPVRQNTQSDRTGAQRGPGYHITIEGTVYQVGTDWRVRVGNVNIPGGGTRGVLIEAEYLPLPTLPNTEFGLVPSFLAALTPPSAAGKVITIRIEDFQWEEILRFKLTPTETESEPVLGDHKMEEDEQPKDNNYDDDDDDDDIYEYADEVDSATPQRGDWTGVERDRRAAFLMWGALKTEGLLL